MQKLTLSTLPCYINVLPDVRAIFQDQIRLRKMITCIFSLFLNIMRAFPSAFQCQAPINLFNCKDISRLKIIQNISYGAIFMLEVKGVLTKLTWLPSIFNLFLPIIVDKLIGSSAPKSSTRSNVCIMSKLVSQ